MTPLEALLWFLLFILGLLIIAKWSISRARPKTSRHIRGEFGGQMELDMRLPYKRFRELYPYSKITYQEYKKMQMERAFRRAVSSERNKRMVR